MLTVSAPLMTDKVKDMLDGYDNDGITIRFVERSGMNLKFDVTGISGYAAVDLAKAIVRSSEYGNALYFGVSWKD